VGPVKDKHWQADPLPRGRHKLSRDDVRASQRDRLIRAMTEVVSEDGWEATTIPKVVKAARVSTNTFYELFDDKVACFLALCEQAGNDLFEDLASFNDAPNWITALEGGLHVYLRWWQDRAALTRAYMIELPAAGHRAVEERDRQHERFKAIIRYLAEWARFTDPDLPPLSRIALDAAVSVPTETIGREVRAGRLDRILDLEEDLRDLLIKLIADDATAARAAAERSP
jgi:AcrR family transcriptional regulator